MECRQYPNPKAKQRKLPVCNSDSGEEAIMPGVADVGKNPRSATRDDSEYDEAFMQKLLDHGLRVKVVKKTEERPSNWGDIWARLNVPRLSVSQEIFTAEAFAEFDMRSYGAVDEDKTKRSVIPIIAGDSADIPHGENISFNNLRDLADGSLAPAKPLFFDGAYPSAIDQRIRDEIGSYIMPVEEDVDDNDKGENMNSGDARKAISPCLPNFFMEILGADRELGAGRRRAFYHGALGARGIHELRSLVDPGNLLNDRAYTITAVYQNSRHGSSLRLYTVHPILIHENQEDVSNSKGRTGYRVAHLGRWELLKGQNNLAAGACALRNAREFAAEQRDELIAKANGFRKRREGYCIVA
ncbi:hypothetical protein FQN54_000717 [Arachnomyces sp. PD_36]|nr:hypothetical protein FQN54_000717 [Arachnomyces sp. PD_36]